MSLQSTGELIADQSLPVTAEIYEQVLDALPVVDIGRLHATSCHARTVAKELRSRVLQRRKLHAAWTWRKAHAVEGAAFCDMSGSTGLWTPGPNSRHGNVMESDTDDEDNHSDGDAGAWLSLSGGTDWQGFQGGFRCLSDDGIRPTWLTFRVRIATPAVSGAFLTFSAAQRTWGLEHIVFAFHYSGDEASTLQRRRCFVVQAGATQHGDASYTMQPEIIADRSYQVVVNFDWAKRGIAVFIDGVRYIDRMPFAVERPIKYAALYNWRSSARTAFSELILGNACPCAVTSDTAPSHPRFPDQKRGICRKRVKPTNPVLAEEVAKASTLSIGNLSRLLCIGAVVIVVAAAAVQHFAAVAVD